MNELEDMRRRVMSVKWKEEENRWKTKWIQEEEKEMWWKRSCMEVMSETFWGDLS